MSFRSQSWHNIPPVSTIIEQLSRGSVRIAVLGVATEALCRVGPIETIDAIASFLPDLEELSLGLRFEGRESVLQAFVEQVSRNELAAPPC